MLWPRLNLTGYQKIPRLHGNLKRHGRKTSLKVHFQLLKVDEHIWKSLILSNHGFHGFSISTVWNRLQINSAKTLLGPSCVCSYHVLSFNSWLSEACLWHCTVAKIGFRQQSLGNPAIYVQMSTCPHLFGMCKIIPLCFEIHFTKDSFTGRPLSVRTIGPSFAASQHGVGLLSKDLRVLCAWLSSSDRSPEPLNMDIHVWETPKQYSDAIDLCLD